ncbi:MAG: hypothetical protein DRJ67_01665 [Thermoprotei archaeon]|nr:MAG: hypothetical protein DRJ67_01665 [Thermoprotei archaeon]
MVVIESIRAVGFRRLKLEQPLTLEKGLTIIRGPNEAGKSSLIEAILFGLYGDANLPSSFRKPIAGAGRVTLSDLVAHDARRAVIEVVFRVGDKRYKVYRVIERRNQSALQVEARLIDLTRNRTIATGVQPVAREVEKIIGVSWKEMLATNVVAQKDLEHLIQLKTRDREAIINMMMGLESFNKAKNWANEEKNRLSRDLESMEEKLENKRKLLKELENTKRQYDKYVKEKEEIERKLPKVKERLEQVEKTTSYLESLYNYLDKKKRLEEAKKTISGILQQIQEEIASKLEKLETLKGKLESTKNEEIKEEEALKNASQRHRAKAEVLSRLESVFSRLERLKAKYDQLQTRLSSRRRDLSGLAKELGVEPGTPVDRWKTEIERKAEIPKLTREIRLPLLLVLLSIPLSIVVLPLGLALLVLGLGLLGYKYHKVQVKKLQHASALARLRDAKEWSREIDGYERELQRLTEEVRATIRQLPDEYKEKIRGGIEEIYESLKAVIETVKQEAGKLEREIDERNTRIKELSNRIKDIEDELRSLEEEVKSKQKELERKQNELHEIEEQLRSLSTPDQSLVVPELYDSENLEEVKRVLKKYRQSLETLRDQKTELETRLEYIVNYIEENKSKVKMLDKVKREIEKLEKNIREVKPRIEALKVVVDSLSSISERLRKSFAPSVERHMGRILNAITGGRYKAVKIDPQKYDIQVFDAQAGRFLPRNIYSGGTNDQFLLAMRIAFTLALLRGAKGTYPRFLFLDEPLGSSDPERRRRILKLLSEELTKYFEQILLITHVETPDVPNALLVTMEDGRVIATRRITEIPEAEI